MNAYTLDALKKLSFRKRKKVLFEKKKREKKEKKKRHPTKPNMGSYSDAPDAPDAGRDHAQERATPQWKVLEFGTYLAAPLLGKYLVDVGYDVTCVVRPAHVRSASVERERIGDEALKQLRRSKTIVELDVISERERVEDLVRNADVIIHNFPVDTVHRMGVDYATCHDLNPRAIYTALPGYASGDAEFGAHNGNYKAWDTILMATTGVFCDMGLNRTLLGVEASFSSLPLSSVYASIYGFLVLSSALRGGLWGRYLEVPLASALSEALVHNSMLVPLDDAYMNRRARAVRDGCSGLTQQELDRLFDPFFCKYFCKDKRPIYLVCPAHRMHQLRALRILGVEQRVADLLHTVDFYSTNYASGLGAGSLDASDADAVRPIMEAAFLTKPAFEWEKLLGNAAVPAIAHRSMQEWMSNEHATRSGLVVQKAREWQIAPLGWFSEGENDDGARFSRAAAKQQKQQMPDDAGAGDNDNVLSDIRVLDLSNVIAGPTIGAMLARFGADVIKIDPPKPAYAPTVSVVYGLAANLGKKSILLDITTPEGRDVLDSLIRTSDMLIINCTPASLRRARLTQSDLHRINPRILLVHFDAWGGPLEDGPWKDFVGYDDNVQAATGIMYRFGGGLCTAEEHAHIGTIDVIAGVACAALAMQALIHRDQTSVVRTTRCSLASVSQYLQFPFIFKTDHAQLGSGISCRGEHALHGCYMCTDGWVVIVADILGPTTRGWEHVQRIFPDATDETQLVRCMRNVSKHWLIDQCARCGIAASVVRRLGEVREQNLCTHYDWHGKTYQYLISSDHPIGVLHIVAPVAMRLNVACPCVAPKYGAHTQSVLSDMRRADVLLKRGVAACQWSKFYMPFSCACDKCRQRGSRLIVLRCGHRTCATCILDMVMCPVCRCLHQTDIDVIRQQVTDWKTQYASWRRGGGRGARDMENILVATVTRDDAKRCVSAPPMTARQIAIL